jgi:outer membrane protein assembly factor BamB
MSGRRTLKVASIVLLALATLAQLPASASATAVIRLVPNHGPPTSRVVAGGGGFQAGETVDLHFDSTLVASSTANVSGAFRAKFNVPGDALPGDHTVSATGNSSGASGQAIFEVRTDWTQFHFDARHTGLNPYENVLDTSNVDDLVWKWEASVHGQVLSSPAVVDGTVYLGSIDNHLYAFDSATGSPQWQAPIGGDVLSSPAIWRGRVFVGSTDGLVYAFNADSGQPLWQTALSAPIFFASPTIARGRLHITASDGTVYALNARNGQKIWVGAAGDYTNSSPAVANGLAYVVSGDGDVYAFPTACSDPCLPQWVADAGSFSNSTPAVAGGRVYVGMSDGDIVALNASNGSVVWTVHAGDGPVDGAPAISNGVVFAGSEGGTLYALDAATGSEVWKAFVGSIQNSPIVANGVVYVASSFLDAFPTTCSNPCAPLWYADVGARLSSPALVDGRIYVGDDSSLLFSYGLP